MEPCGIKIEFVYPKNEGFQELILNEAHNLAYSIHPGAIKMLLANFTDQIRPSIKLQKDEKLAT
jgi:hypothetical protein